jgi:hypothetical protein
MASRYQLLLEIRHVDVKLAGLFARSSTFRKLVRPNKAADCMPAHT